MRNTSGSYYSLSAYAAPVIRDRGRLAGRTASWMALDFALAIYVTFVAIVAGSAATMKYQYWRAG